MTVFAGYGNIVVPFTYIVEGRKSLHIEVRSSSDRVLSTVVETDTTKYRLIPEEDHKSIYITEYNPK